MSQVLNNRYLVVSNLGQGGMGAVYKAQDTQLGNRLVAVKEMLQVGTDKQGIQEAAMAFKKEADLLAGLQHPNLPSVYEHFEEGGRWYLVMSFIDGENLSQYLSQQGGKLSVEEVLDMGKQLCSVLDYLHTRQPPIIFRDLKPLNVMHSVSGHLYLIDFGIARHFKMGQTRDTVLAYSQGYAAPEQFGQAQTTVRSDIYSLGATLHHLISGNHPSTTPFRFAPIPTYGQPALERLNRLLLSMVEMDDTRRPASMAVVKQDLLQIASLYTLGQSQTQSSNIGGNSSSQGFSSQPPLSASVAQQQQQRPITGQRQPYTNPDKAQRGQSVASSKEQDTTGSGRYTDPPGYARTPPPPPMQQPHYPPPYAYYPPPQHLQYPAGQPPIPPGARHWTHSRLRVVRPLSIVSVICIVVGIVVFSASSSSSSYSSSNSGLAALGGLLLLLGFILCIISWIWLLVCAAQRKQTGWIIAIAILGMFAGFFYALFDPGAEHKRPYA